MMDWLARWRSRGALEASPPAQRALAMRRTSPLYIARNHRVEEALAAASVDSDLAPFRRLLDVLAQPFDERPGLESYTAPAPPEITARYRTFCGT